MSLTTSEKTITTIIPFYNCGRSLTTMLDSILKGSVVPSEILLIDDGSTDDSLSIANKYAGEHPMIKCLRKEHAGVSAARNFGISHASGYWISFLDADDYIEPDMYEQMLSAITADNIDGCICGYFTHKEDAVMSYAKESSRVMSSSEILEGMFTDDDIRGFLFTRLFKASQIKSYLFDTTISMCEDLLLQSKFFSDADRNFVYIPKPFYHYIQNSSSATATPNLFVNCAFKYKPAFDKISSIISEEYVQQSYNSILEYSMYTQLIAFKSGNHSQETLKQIKMLQKELKATPCKNKTKRRLAYESAPILFSCIVK